MYDVATQTVSKLNGELSSAFVEAAEANSDDTEVAASETVHRVVAYSKIDREGVESKVNNKLITNKPLRKTLNKLCNLNILG